MRLDVDGDGADVGDDVDDDLDDARDDDDDDGDDLPFQEVILWHPGSERPVYLTLPAQRSSLLAMLNILVQKQPLHL